MEGCNTIACSSIRNAAILFGDDAYWGDFYDGTVTFAGTGISLQSQVSNCITAAGIAGKNLTVNFTGAADKSSGISFSCGQATGPGNEAIGILARNDLTINGNFGGSITSYFDFSLLSGTRFATAAGLYASGDLTVSGGISGTIVPSCFTVDQPEYSEAFGLYAGKSLTVSGELGGTIAALAESSAYRKSAVYASGKLQISVRGTLFAGRSSAGQTPDDFLQLLNDPAGNEATLKTLSAGSNAVYGGAESDVTLNAGAAVWGNIRLGKNSNLTISSEANVYGDADFSTAYSSPNVTFLLENISVNSVVRGRIYYGAGDYSTCMAKIRFEDLWKEITPYSRVADEAVYCRLDQD